MSLFDILGKAAAIEKIQWFIASREPTPIPWGNWYVGISAEPSQRVYGEHNALIQDSIIVAVESEEAARSVEKFFVELKSTAGGLGGGLDPRFVYAFKMRPDTVPPLK